MSELDRLKRRGLWWGELVDEAHGWALAMKSATNALYGLLLGAGLVDYANGRGPAAAMVAFVVTYLPCIAFSEVCYQVAKLAVARLRVISARVEKLRAAKPP